MKRFLALFLAAALCLFSAALAQSDSSAEETPFDSAPSVSDSADGMTLTLDGRALSLTYDSDPAYSMVEDGFVQASFYAYDSDGTLYELYLFFPQTAVANSIISTQTEIQINDNLSSIILCISTYTSELYALASQEQGAAYPEGSNYVYSFGEVTQMDAATVYSGSFEATLILVDDQDNPLTDCAASGSFHFTMSDDSSEASAAPDLPQATLPPSFSIPSSPILTPPPEARKI